MNCPACQAENAPKNKFCGECGARLPVTCPACGQPSPAGQKFCGECGAPLAPAGEPPARAQRAGGPPDPIPPAAASTPSAAAAPAFRELAPVTYTPKHLAEKILTSRGAVEGERKTVTVMFSDVSGFTAMSERLDPEEVHAIMDRAFAVILEAVHRYEGTINQFLGDGVMALFGAPIAHEDHAQRALGTALAIQEGLQPLAADIRRTHGIEFRMRMGINTGPVVVGAIGRDLRMDYTAVGDTTNLAARLLALAQPGQIVVSRRTQHLRDRSFLFEDLGEFQVKGKSEPVRAYALVGEDRSRTGREAPGEGGRTPLAGRTRELEQLEAIFQRAAGGAGSVVRVSGDPGAGKSRLLHELLSRLEGPGVLPLEAACASYGAVIPYRPILELVRRYLDLPEGAAPVAVRAAIAERLEELSLEGEERAVLLAHFLGVSASPEFVSRLSAAELKLRTLTALRDLFLHASRSTPLVLLLENVHWLDPSSAELLAHLVPALPGHRVLLLLSTRPGLVPWISFPNVETIAVDPLGEAEVEGMARALLGANTMAPALMEILVQKGAGNPLYVEEIVHQLRETGAIVVEDGEARLRSAGLKIPATINDIIAARVDRLAEPLKLALQGAAVVGRRFGVPLVSRVIETDAAEVGRQLQDLHELDFITPSAHDPELLYRFKHALTQDVVYAGLLERRRRRYHAAAAHAFEELFAGRLDDVVEILARHFGLSAEDDRAVDWALQAAEKSQRRWAQAEALAYFESALRRLGSMPDTPANRLRRIDAVVKQAEVKFALGKHAEHVEALEGIRELVDGIDDPRRRASWYYWTGFLRSLIGSRPEIPIAYCREAAAIAEASGLDDIRAFTECCLAHVLMAAGDLAGAIEAGERALETFQARGNVWWACRALWALIPVANSLGDWQRGLEYSRRALDHGLAVNDLRLKVVGWWRMGSVHILRGDAEAGLRCCEEAMALSPVAFDAAMSRGVRGYGLVKLGQIDAGAAELEETVAWLERSQLYYTRSIFALFLAEAQLYLGRRQEACAAIERVLAASRDSGHRHLEGIAERALAETLERGDPAAASHLESALRICEAVGAKNEVAKALVAQAGHRRAAGDVSGARHLLEGARAIFESLGTVDGPPLVAALLDVLDTRARPEAPPRHWLIVARGRAYLHAVLSRELAADADVTVVMDRRISGPDSPTNGRPRDRRRIDTGETVDARLREAGFAVAPAGNGG